MEGRIVDLCSKLRCYDLARVLHEDGFAIIRNHGISSELIQEVYGAWAKYFQCNERFQDIYDAKTQNRHYSTQSGYYPFESPNHLGGVVKRSVEYYHIFASTLLHERHGSKETMMLGARLNKLGLDLLELLDEGTVSFDPTSGHLQSVLFSPLREMAAWSDKTLMRVLHYPPLEGNERHNKRSYGHKDPNLITLIPAPTGAGLQVFSGNKWIDIEMQPDDIFVNIGDMLEIVSNGYYKATLHQVAIPEGNAAKVARYSTPFFIYPHPEVKISESLTAHQFLVDRLAQLGYD